VCFLLAQHKQLPFLNRIVTGDEKWKSYNNAALKRSWSVPGEPTENVGRV